MGHMGRCQRVFRRSGGIGFQWRSHPHDILLLFMGRVFFCYSRLLCRNANRPVVGAAAAAKIFACCRMLFVFDIGVLDLARGPELDGGCEFRQDD
jgi:hypothetical protein